MCLAARGPLCTAAACFSGAAYTADVFTWAKWCSRAVTCASAAARAPPQAPRKRLGRWPCVSSRSSSRRRRICRHRRRRRRHLCRLDLGWTPTSARRAELSSLPPPLAASRPASTCCAAAMLSSLALSRARFSLPMSRPARCWPPKAPPPLRAGLRRAVRNPALRRCWPRHAQPAAQPARPRAFWPCSDEDGSNCGSYVRLRKRKRGGVSLQSLFPFVLHTAAPPCAVGVPRKTGVTRRPPSRRCCCAGRWRDEGLLGRG